jgi:RND family efflux transporter MFP subunit
MKRHSLDSKITPVLLAAFLVMLSACGERSQTDLSDAGNRAVPVTAQPAATRDVRVELYSIGRLVSRNTPTLAAEINARVLEFLVDEGEAVHEGQVLIRLDTTTAELSRQEAVADIERLQVSIANEERRVARYRDLKTRDMMPQERLDDAEAKLAADRATMAAAQARLAIAEDRLEKACMVSPVNGIVEKRHVSVGDYAKVGSPLITVTDTQSLRAELPFPETVGSRLQEGQKILLESPLAPGITVETTVDHVRPHVGMMSRALVVIADVKNPGAWRPEATVDARLGVEQRPDAVVVPTLSLVRRPAGDVVFVLDSPSATRVSQRVVSVGQRLNGTIEIREGLDAGEWVAVEGAQYLTDGATVAVAEGALP